MAAKRHKKHKNKISGLVISICYNEQKIEILTSYESINVEHRIMKSLRSAIKLN